MLFDVGWPIGTVLTMWSSSFLKSCDWDLGLGWAPACLGSTDGSGQCLSLQSKALSNLERMDKRDDFGLSLSECNCPPQRFDIWSFTIGWFDGQKCVFMMKGVKVIQTQLSCKF